MKVIFLDFDGVITTLKSGWELDNKKQLLVKQICDATGAKIVISSSCRRYNLARNIESLSKEVDHPFILFDYLIDVTPWMYSSKHSERETHYFTPRGVEIQRWLAEHKDVTNYVILDDDSDMLLAQKPYFIKTHGYYGICPKNVKGAIKILSMDKTNKIIF